MKTKHLYTVSNKEIYDKFKNSNPVDFEKYINLFIEAEKENDENLSKNDVFTLLLSECVKQRDVDTVKYILENHYHDGLLTDIDVFNRSPISFLFMKKDAEIESTVKQFIKTHSIPKTTLTGEYFKDMHYLLGYKGEHYEGYIQDFLKPLFLEEHVEVLGKTMFDTSGLDNGIVPMENL
ncbi:hypothetical protein Trichorick_01524 (plasmid) [Candidatus Trichorickettsia mobilis]|uniref:hypothetical protein n=1 Tax=Candidatus Trichorickettsia mobilis TaxID=1346319 RepID=UPI002B26275B|nr:hypothetical protein [Candidatus Trichorickettsia mobilis]WPY01610.1 hypothetical protein Trichorick_01524 [Candidatus Trichorickettsia mobilis]